VVMMTDRLITR